MKQYSEEFDAYYDDDTNEWLESVCDDPTCEYCTERPEKPLNMAEFSDCDCGCNIPVAQTPERMLRFLLGRFQYGGVADSVAAIYARDIKYVLDKHYGTDQHT